MTVTYTAKVATVKFKTLWILLGRWRGSVYKHVWKDGLLFLTLYYIINIVYRWAPFNENQRQIFEKIVVFCDSQTDRIPVAFVLGFYVNLIVIRWWSQVNDIMPWPDTIAVTTTTLLHGEDDRGRILRRTLVRYVNLSWILALCNTSTVAKKRFPTLDHLIDIGMMTRSEKEVYEGIKTSSSKYFVPLVWALTLVTRARKEGRIYDDHSYIKLVEVISKFREGLGYLYNYDWMSVPLVYTQVVTIAVYSYFVISLFGKQFIRTDQGYPNNQLDIYVPMFTMFEFLFYMGWLKVAESLLNPFGEDDDDFDTNAVFDRNVQVSYLIVDDMYSVQPEMLKDAYWDAMDFELPYTAATEQFKVEPYLGSTNELELDGDDLHFIPPPTIPEETETDLLISPVDHLSSNQSKESTVSRDPGWLQSFLYNIANAKQQFSNHGRRRRENANTQSIGTVSANPSDTTYFDGVSYKRSSEQNEVFYPCASAQSGQDDSQTQAQPSFTPLIRMTAPRIRKGPAPVWSREGLANTTLATPSFELSDKIQLASAVQLPTLKRTFEELEQNDTDTIDMSDKPSVITAVNPNQTVSPMSVSANATANTLVVTNIASGPMTPPNLEAGSLNPPVDQALVARHTYGIIQSLPVGDGLPLPRIELTGGSLETITSDVVININPEA